MDVYCFVLLLYCFLFFVFTDWALSFAWALELCSRDMCWRVSSLSYGCQEGTEEGGVKVRWRQVVWSWKPGGFDFCWKFLIVARAQWLGNWLKWSDSCLGRKLWCRFEKGVVGWKGIVICNSWEKALSYAVAGQVKRLTGSFLSYWKCLFFLALTSLGRRDGWSGLVWLLGERGQAMSWDCHVKWTFGSSSHSLKHSICHSGFHS